MLAKVIFLLLFSICSSLKLKCEIIKKIDKRNSICLNLDLEIKNDLTSIDKVEASFNGTITILHLMSENMHFVPLKIFEKFPNLQEFKITTETPRITNLHQDLFFGGKSLKQLYITNQKIQHLESNTFAPLSNILRLILPFNQIKFIHRKAFEGLKNCILLDLYGNFIKYIDWKFLESLPGLKELNLQNNRLLKAEEDLPKKNDLKISIQDNTCSALNENPCEVSTKCNFKCESLNCNFTQTRRRMRNRKSFLGTSSGFVDDIMNEIDRENQQIYSEYKSNLDSETYSVPQFIEDIPNVCNDFKKSSLKACESFQFSYNYFKTCGPSFLIEKSCNRYKMQKDDEQSGFHKIDAPYKYDEILSATSNNYFFAEFCIRAQNSKFKCKYNKHDSKFCSDILVIIGTCVKMLPTYAAHSKEELSQNLQTANHFRKYIDESKKLFIEFTGSEENFDIYAGRVAVLPQTTTTLAPVKEEPWWNVWIPRICTMMDYLDIVCTLAALVVVLAPWASLFCLILEFTAINCNMVVIGMLIHDEIKHYSRRMIEGSRPPYMTYCETLRLNFDCDIFKNDVERCDMAETLRDHCVPFFEDFEKKIVRKETEVVTYETKPEGERSSDCSVFCHLMRETLQPYCENFKLQLTAFVFCKLLKLLNKQCMEAEIFTEDLKSSAAIDENSLRSLNNILIPDFCKQVKTAFESCSSSWEDSCKTIESLNFICSELPKINENLKELKHEDDMAYFFKYETNQLQKELDTYINLHEQTYIKWSDDKASSPIQMSNDYYAYLRESDLEFENFNMICRFVDFFYTRRHYCKPFSSCCLLNPTISLIVHYCHKYATYNPVLSTTEIDSTLTLPIYEKYCEDIAKNSLIKKDCKKVLETFNRVLLKDSSKV